MPRKTKLTRVTPLDSLRDRQQAIALKLAALVPRRPLIFAHLAAEFKEISRQIEQQQEQQAS
jgi:hypothetical protein